MTAGACLVLSLTACAGQAGNARLAQAEASGDGTLRIGLILDNVGDRSFLNDSQRTAARLAVQEINAAGGHKGKPVELLPEKVNEDASGQARELVAAKADVVIGPTDSSHAGEAIDVLARAKVTLISPANTAMAPHVDRERRLTTSHGSSSPISNRAVVAWWRQWFEQPRG